MGECVTPRAVPGLAEFVSSAPDCVRISDVAVDGDGRVVQRTFTSYIEANEFLAAIREAERRGEPAERELRSREEAWKKASYLHASSDFCSGMNLKIALREGGEPAVRALLGLDSEMDIRDAQALVIRAHDDDHAPEPRADALGPFNQSGAALIASSGLLGLINRMILHPFGLAIDVTEDESHAFLVHATTRSGGFPTDADYALENHAKLEAFLKTGGAKRIAARRTEMGFVVQPVDEIGSGEADLPDDRPATMRHQDTLVALAMTIGSDDSPIGWVFPTGIRDRVMAALDWATRAGAGAAEIEKARADGEAARKANAYPEMHLRMSTRTDGHPFLCPLGADVFAVSYAMSTDYPSELEAHKRPCPECRARLSQIRTATKPAVNPAQRKRYLQTPCVTCNAAPGVDCPHKRALGEGQLVEMDLGYRPGDLDMLRLLLGGRLEIHVAGVADGTVERNARAVGPGWMERGLSRIAALGQKAGRP